MIKPFLFKNGKAVIGALHFMPLMGFDGYMGLERVLAKAKKDLEILQNGGVDAVIIENNYDLPHKIQVGPETVSSMTYLGAKLAKIARIPLGVSVLWNDYKAALTIAKCIGAKFIRIPVFVDKVKTSYGTVLGKPREIHKYAKLIGAEDILLFTDIHVKHAKILNKHTIVESARSAIDQGSDALIVTGKWTAEAPDLKDLKDIRSVVGNFPILSGSGANIDNICNLLEYVDGAIVSTSLKEGKKESGNVNIKSYKEYFSLAKVKMLVGKVKNYGK